MFIAWIKFEQPLRMLIVMYTELQAIVTLVIQDHLLILTIRLRARVFYEHIVNEGSNE